MPDSHHHNPFHIGMRNVKTALAATICAVVYFILDMNPTFACIGAIFGMGSDMVTSKLSGGNRFFGTLIGGLIGMALFRIYILVYPEGGHHPLLLVLLFIGVLMLVVTSTGFHWAGAIQPGGVVLCIILFNTPVDTYMEYCVNRIIDTGVGVLVALAVNWLFPREKVIAWLEKYHMRKKQLQENPWSPSPLHRRGHFLCCAV